MNYKTTLNAASLERMHAQKEHIYRCYRLHSKSRRQAMAHGIWSLSQKEITSRKLILVHSNMLASTQKRMGRAHLPSFPNRIHHIYTEENNKNI